MNNTDRLAVLQWIEAQLSELLTDEELRTYPLLEHLQDLISDLEGEQDEG